MSHVIKHLSLNGLSQEEPEVLSKKKTKLKIDLRIFIILCWIYTCKFLGRTNIESARFGGLEDDLKIDSIQYQTAISILFVGYIIMPIPCNIIMNRLEIPPLFITVIMTAWRIISTCTSAVKSQGGLIAVRCILGFVESGFYGSCLYYLSCYYTMKELGLRNSIPYSRSLISRAFSDLISTGIIENMDHVRGLKSWRWCFIIGGTTTVAIVPLAYLHLL